MGPSRRRRGSDVRTPPGGIPRPRIHRILEGIRPGHRVDRPRWDGTIRREDNDIHRRPRPRQAHLPTSGIVRQGDMVPLELARDSHWAIRSRPIRVQLGTQAG